MMLIVRFVFVWCFIAVCVNLVCFVWGGWVV